MIQGISQEVMKCLQEIADNKGKPYVVGGFVRDYIMGMQSKDIDIEVFGLNPDALKQILSHHGEVNAVGSAFGVIKVNVGGDDCDFSIPRRDNKQGRGHKGFIVDFDSTLTEEEAASRRDFTMNSMFMDPFNGNLVDPYKGRLAIKNNILHATSRAFVEDPLRVLRGMQFASRFGMEMSMPTVRMCQEMRREFKTLPKDRVREEFHKMATKGQRRWDMGMDVLCETNWILNFPEIKVMEFLEQDSEWHPEGDVLQHTLEVMEQGGRLSLIHNLNERDSIILMYACLCHDMGKVTTTEKIDGRWASHGHDEAGEKPTRSFLESLGESQDIIEEVVALVKCHMRHVRADGEGISAKSVRRLARDVQPSNIQMLSLVVEADHSGRGTQPKGMPESMQKILATAESISVVSKAPDGIVMGRHLIEWGLRPSPEFGNILRCTYEAQLDGEITSVEDGKMFLQKKGTIK